MSCSGVWWCPVAQLVPSVLEVIHANAAIFPPHPVLNEKREGAGGHPCRLDISLRSCCGRRGTVAFFTSQYVLVIKKEKIQTKYSILWKGKQLQQERIAAFFHLGFRNNPNAPSEILAPDSPQRHTECNDWSDKRKKTKTNKLGNMKTQQLGLEI